MNAGSATRTQGRPVRSVDILGVRVDDVTLDQTLDIVDEFIRSGSPHLIVTTNPEFVMAAQRDEEFRRVLRGSDLSIPDGVGLIWASRLLGAPLSEHVRGSDTVECLMARAAERGYAVFLLGAAEGVAAAAAEKLKARYPRLRVAGTYSGSPRPEDDDAIVRHIQSAGPVDILLVAYGAPAQEKWIARNLHRLNIPVAIGVGGVFDFLAGRVKRAPRWVRRLELEWLYRLIRQPWRWRRQLALPRFAAHVLALWLRARLGRGRA